MITSEPVGIKDESPWEIGYAIWRAHNGIRECERRIRYYIARMSVLKSDTRGRLQANAITDLSIVLEEIHSAGQEVEAMIQHLQSLPRPTKKEA